MVEEGHGAHLSLIICWHLHLFIAMTWQWALLTVCMLSNEQKYQILTAKPCQLSEYPLNKQKRHFQSQWIKQYPWIHYSESDDGAFCAVHYFVYQSSSQCWMSHHPFEIGKLPLENLIEHNVASILIITYSSDAYNKYISVSIFIRYTHAQMPRAEMWSFIASF